MRHMKSFFKDLTMYERKLCYPSFAIHSKQVYGICTFFQYFFLRERRRYREKAEAMGSYGQAINYSSPLPAFSPETPPMEVGKVWRGGPPSWKCKKRGTLHSEGPLPPLSLHCFFLHTPPGFPVAFTNRRGGAFIGGVHSVRPTAAVAVVIAEEGGLSEA